MAKGRGQAAQKAAPADDIERDELVELLERVGGEAAYMRVYRLEAGERVHLRRMGPEGTIDDIQEHYGGGDYLVQVCSQDGRVKGSRRLKIAGRPRDPDDGPADQERLVGYSATPANAGRAPRTLGESIAQLQEVLEGARNPPPVAQQGNPLEMSIALVTALGTAAGPIIELLKDRRPKGEGGGAVRMMEAYQNGLRTGVMLMKKHGAGEAAAGSNDILGRMLDTIGGLTRGGAAAPLEDPLALPTGELGGGAIASGANAARGVKLEKSWTEAVAPYVPRLQTLARQGKDPHLYADLLLDQASDELLELLMVQLNRGEDFWREFTSAFPGTDRAWFQELLNRVWLGCQPDDGGAENPGDVPPSNDAT